MPPKDRKTPLSDKLITTTLVAGTIAGTVIAGSWDDRLAPPTGSAVAKAVKGRGLAKKPAAQILPRNNRELDEAEAEAEPGRNWTKAAEDSRGGQEKQDGSGKKTMIR